MALAAAVGPAGAEPEVIRGPVPARVVRVVDGDTVVVRARIWLGQEVETRVRLEGVDTPELRGGCDHERHLAQRARAFVAMRAAGQAVVLWHIRYGKYAGRVVARIETADGEDLSLALISAGLGRPDRGGQRLSWCG
jgi:endonuclease YncB( thermonuclease family)